MKRTGFKIKQRKPLKRTEFKKKQVLIPVPFYVIPAKTALRRTKLRKVGKSATSKIKTHIQALLREIVVQRDGGCILQNTYMHRSWGETKEILQAEHLISRANNATYADERLVVCICKKCHTWKHLSKVNTDTYNIIIKTILSKETVDLWNKSYEERNNICRKGEYEWKQEAIRLKKLIDNKQKYGQINTIANL